VYTFFLTITLFLTIPFSMVVLYTGLGLQGVCLPLRQLLPYAAAIGSVLAAFRVLPVPFGLHSLVYLCLVAVSLRRLHPGRLSMVILTSLLTSVIAAVGEGLVSMPVLTLLGVPINQVTSDPWYAVLGGWLGNSLVVAVAIYLMIRRRFGAREA
jgi:hypothetical protein